MLQSSLESFLKNHRTSRPPWAIQLSQASGWITALSAAACDDGCSAELICASLNPASTSYISTVRPTVHLTVYCKWRPKQIKTHQVSFALKIARQRTPFTRDWWRWSPWPVCIYDPPVTHGRYRPREPSKAMRLLRYDRGNKYWGVCNSYIRMRHRIY